MARALGLAVALLLLVVASASALSEPSGKLVAGSEETVLRLHDLPPGYQVGDDSGCGPWFLFGEGEEPEGRLEKRYLRWIVENWPEGCFYEYEQIFKVPGLGAAPPQVEAETLNTPSEAAAVEGLQLYNALIDRSAEGEPKMVTISPAGAQARLLRDRDTLVAGKKGQPRSFLVWRHGKQLSFLTVAGLDPHRNDRAVVHFAEIQQRRLEAPTPYTEAERDDTEVWLDDPALKLPVYWVGRAFQPGGGLPATELEEAFTIEAGRGGPPGQKVALWYDGFTLGSWGQGGWKRYVRSRLGRTNLAAPCTDKEPLSVEGGSAMLFATYDGRFRKCPQRKPDRFYAVVHLGGTVVGVNLGDCFKCRPGATGPYGTKRGVLAVVRALTQRPKPIYSQPR
jgi:hypothetical protein